MAEEKMKKLFLPYDFSKKYILPPPQRQHS